MVYKFEGSTDVQVALELTTGDASSCHVGGMLVLNGERLGDFMEERWLALGGAAVGRAAMGRSGQVPPWVQSVVCGYYLHIETC
jgi:hypothetical protein